MARCASTQGIDSGGYVHEGSLAALTILTGLASLTYLNTSKCDDDVYSSSDSMDMPSPSDEGDPLEPFYLAEIKSSNAEDLKDDKSEFSKSVRAFGAGLESTDAIRRQETPLATSKEATDADSAEDRVSTLGAHEHATVTTQKVYFYHAEKIVDKAAEKFVLLAGPSSEDLGGDIGHLLGVPVSKAEVGQYADG
jgi:hypothetical protein